jgi:hypothetical protein
MPNTVRTLQLSVNKRRIPVIGETSVKVWQSNGDEENQPLFSISV